MDKRILENKFENEQTKLFNKYGVFFAFGKHQYNEKAKPNIEYCSALGMGDCCPRENVEAFISELSELHKNYRKEKLQTYGRKKVILKSLYNFECFYTYDVSEAVEDLKLYKIKEDEVKQVFIEEVERSMI